MSNLHKRIVERKKVRFEKLTHIDHVLSDILHNFEFTDAQDGEKHSALAHEYTIEIKRISEHATIYGRSTKKYVSF